MYFWRGFLTDRDVVKQVGLIRQPFINLPFRDQLFCQLHCFRDILLCGLATTVVHNHPKQVHLQVIRQKGVRLLPVRQDQITSPTLLWKSEPESASTGFEPFLIFLFELLADARSQSRGIRDTFAFQKLILRSNHAITLNRLLPHRRSRNFLT